MFIRRGQAKLGEGPWSDRVAVGCSHATTHAGESRRLAKPRVSRFSGPAGGRVDAPKAIRRAESTIAGSVSGARSRSALAPRTRAANKVLRAARDACAVAAKAWLRTATDVTERRW